jgi:ATP-dependent Clp endopeptidase proteolytic subunit ClpP
MTDIYWASKKNKNERSEDSGETATIEVVGNHIYFYNGVEIDTALKLNKTIQDTSLKLLNISRQHGIQRPILNLHINSGGGVVSAGVSVMDTIRLIKRDVDIHTYVEGRCASASTFISCVGTKRFITRNSLMLIHQLSSGVWGKYNELIDHKENMDLIMTMIKRIYKENTKVPESDLDNILNRDIYWDANKCLEMGLVDEVV